MKKLTTFVLSLGMAHFAFAQDVQQGMQYRHTVWDGVPINAVVPTGKERIISFPGKHIEFNGETLTHSEVGILLNGNKVYIDAKKPFKKQRTLIKLDTGQTVLMDVSSKKDADDTPLEVLLPAPTKAFDATQSNQNKSMISMITLMRYAVQHTYAPERLVKNSQYISRAAMYTQKTVNLFYQDQVMSMPLVSWSGGGMYVTVVMLKNIWNQPITLNPMKTYGNFKAISFYPSNKLSPKGQADDTTSAFFISSEPFGQALAATKEYRI
tara:strand:- start:1151 stop:1951 length:801 start_codon:yes stop_codon:yes gene_type:complete